MKRKLYVVIPAYNEAASIANTISELKSYGKFQVLVVDDGSTDETVQIARQAGADCISVGENKGIGNAMSEGVKRALKDGCKLMVRLDADGQHDPKYIKVLLDYMEDKEADVVIGSRYVSKTNYQTEFLRKVGIVLLSKTIEWKLKKKIYDPTSGYRLYNLRAMETLKDNYGAVCPEPGSIARLLQNNFRVVEVPVEMRPRFAGYSHMSLMAGIRCVFFSVLRIITG